MTSTRPGYVIGFPALASTSMEQGRLASCHMFGIPFKAHAQSFSLRYLYDSGNIHGGPDRGSINGDKIPYEVGIAKYSELAKSMMLGDETG